MFCSDVTAALVPSHQADRPVAFVESVFILIGAVNIGDRKPYIAGKIQTSCEGLVNSSLSVTTPKRCKKNLATQLCSARVPEERLWKKASLSCVMETTSDTIYIDVDVDPRDIGYIEIYLR